MKIGQFVQNGALYINQWDVNCLIRKRKRFIYLFIYLTRFAPENGSGEAAGLGG
jgi:hypothetical protein